MELILILLFSFLLNWTITLSSAIKEEKNTRVRIQLITFSIFLGFLSGLCIYNI